MTEQDNHITPDQNTPDNSTTEQTTTQLNAPHYITKSPQHNTKNLPLQVLGDETSGHLEISSHEVVRVKLAPVELPEMSEEQLSFAREWVKGMLFSREGVKMMQEFMDESPPVSVEVISVGEIEIEGEMEESLSHEQYVKLVVNMTPVTQEQASGLMAAVHGYGVPLTEDEQAEAREKYDNWQDDVLTPIEVPTVIQDWWKDEKGEI